MTDLEIEILRTQIRARGAGGDPGLSRPITGADSWGDPTYQALRMAGQFKDESPDSASAINSKLTNEDLNKVGLALAGFLVSGFAAFCGTGWALEAFVFGSEADQNRAQLVRTLGR